MIINEKKVLEIIDNVKCPQLGSKDYGKWGVLRAEQRELINDLCESWLYKNELLDNYIKNWNELKEYIRKTKIKEFEKAFGKRYGKTFTQAELIVCNMLIDKMQELEDNDER